MEHLELSELLDGAAGNPEARHAIAPHVGVCTTCRRKLAFLLGILDSVARRLGPQRSSCPSVEEIACIPPGAEQDHSHVFECPLCRMDLALLRDLESRQNLGNSIAGRIPQRAQSSIEQRNRLRLVAGRAPKEISLNLRTESEISGHLAGAEVAMRVRGMELIVEIRGISQKQLLLVLENESLMMRIMLSAPRMDIGIKFWTRAFIMDAGEE